MLFLNIIVFLNLQLNPKIFCYLILYKPFLFIIKHNMNLQSEYDFQPPSYQRVNLI